MVTSCDPWSNIMSVSSSKPHSCLKDWNAHTNNLTERDLQSLLSVSIHTDQSYEYTVTVLSARWWSGSDRVEPYARSADRQPADQQHVSNTNLLANPQTDRGYGCLFSFFCTFWTSIIWNTTASNNYIKDCVTALVFTFICGMSAIISRPLVCLHRSVFLISNRGTAKPTTWQIWTNLGRNFPRSSNGNEVTVSMVLLLC